LYTTFISHKITAVDIPINAELYKQSSQLTVPLCGTILSISLSFKNPARIRIPPSGVGKGTFYSQCYILWYGLN
jgi:hypothetical protein